jgi:hypothetical protein
MIAILLIPILICGITILKGHPYESLKLGAYKGWPIYLYAVKYGTLAFFTTYIFADVLIPFYFETLHGNNTNLTELKLESFLSPISIENKDKSLISIISVFLYNLNNGENITSIYSLDKQSIFSFKLFSLSVLSIFASITSVEIPKFTKFFISKIIPGIRPLLYNNSEQKISDVYKEKSPSDFILLQIANKFVNQANYSLYVTEETEHYEKKNTFQKDVNTLRKKAKTYSLMNKLINLIKKTYNSFCTNETAQLKLIEPKFTEAVTMYAYLEAEEKKAYEAFKNYLLYEADERTYALITLNSRKIYIGVPISTGKPDEEGIENKEILILPSFSGFRDEKKLLIEITNKYIINHADHTHTDLIAIPKAQINTVSAFSLSMHKIVEKNMSKEKSSYFIKYYVNKS